MIEWRANVRPRCKCAINTQATFTVAYATVNDDGVAEISQAGMDLAQENVQCCTLP